MTKVLLATIAALSVLSASAYADEKGLPKEFWGKWCVKGSATGGGSPRFMYYSRSRAECDAQDIPKQWRDGDMTLGPYRMDNCKAIERIDWKEDGAPVYFVIYRCKQGKLTAKFALDRDENGLTAQYYWK